MASKMSSGKQEDSEANTFSLTKIFSDIGPDSCDLNMFLDIFQQTAGKVLRTSIDAQLADTLAMMCQQSGRSALDSHWLTEDFGRAALESFPKLDINRIFTFLDQSPHIINDPHGAEMFIKCLRSMSKRFYEQLDSHALFSPWRNEDKHLSLIFNMLLLNPEAFNFSLLKVKRVLETSTDMSSTSLSMQNTSTALISSTWNCMPLFEYITTVITGDHFDYAKPIFELASRQCPELLCLALASLDPSWNSINKEILVKLSCGFLLGQPTSAYVLPRIWSRNPNVLLFCMVEMYRRDTSCLSRLLDIAQELKILPVILDAKPYSFTLDLACLAARRQVLNLEKWFSEALHQKGEMFIKEAVNFLHLKASGIKSPSNTNTGAVPVDFLVIILEHLIPLAGSLPVDCQEALKESRRIILGDSDSRNLGGNLGGAMGYSDVSFASDVEEEVNNIFDRIFARELGIPQVLQALRKLKDSNNLREQQVYNCFLHNLFDEYRFFGKYPDNELSLAAVLFGQVINGDVFSPAPLQVALRCVLDSLGKSPNQKLFRFGLQALAQFHSRLIEWPQVCLALLQNAHIQQNYPDLYSYIQNSSSGTSAMRRAEASAIRSDASLSTHTLGQTSGHNEEPVAFQTESATASVNNILIDFVEKSNVISPSESVKDRILFILNNISSTNLETKANDLVKQLEETHFAWLAQYLVVRRACIEPNYHKLYINFLEVLQVHALDQQVLSQTFSGIYLLLGSSKIVTSSGERSLLKNLGSWLGSLTIGRNIPILHRDLNLKNLLLDAFNNDSLLTVIPFVCKVIEHCAHSIAFRPENPWLMSILRFLAELYNFTEMKLNLKFEVEVLCKNLGVDLYSLTPSNIIRKNSHMTEADVLNSQNSPHSANKGIDSNLESVLEPFIVLGARLSVVNRNSPILAKTVALAIEFALREVAPSAIEAGLKQAYATTRSIALNDLGADSDELLETHVRNMVIALSVATATSISKDALRSTIVNNLRVFLQWVGLSISPEAIEYMADDNLTITCAFLEKFTHLTAQSSVNTRISQLRAELKGSESNRLNLASKISLENVSEIYSEYGRLFANAEHSELPVFKLDPIKDADLEKISRYLSSLASDMGRANLAGIMSSQVGPSEVMSPGVPAPESNLDAYFENVCNKFIDLVNSIEKSITKVGEEYDSASKLPPSHEIRSLMKQIVLLASSSPIHRDELCLLMSQKLMQGLYRTSSPLYVDVIILLLIKIFEFSSKAAKEVTNWVVHSTDERKYSVIATTALFGSGLIYVLDFDGQLAQQVEHGRSDVVVPFAVALIRRCVFSERPIAAPYDFVYTLESLGKLQGSYEQDSEKAGNVRILTDDAANTSIKSEVTVLLRDVAKLVKAPQPESQHLRDQITFCFTDWFRLCQYPSISDKLISSFVAQLYHKRFMADESSARPFFQICTELAIELYVRQRRAPAILSYRSIDAYARLVGQIVKLHPGTRSELGNVDPLRIVTIVHSIAGMVFVQGLEQGLYYLQRPFTRLFTSICSELMTSPEVMHGQHLDVSSVMENLCSCYLLISPRFFPSFAFGWLELVINRNFLPHLLSDSSRGWELLLELLKEYLCFAEPLLNNINNGESVRALYRGLVRCFLIILHDSPDFFVEHGASLVSLIPLTAIQLRNTILSAVPSYIETLPDPLKTVQIFQDAKIENAAKMVAEASRALTLDARMVLESIFYDKTSSKKGAISELVKLLFSEEGLNFHILNATVTLGLLSDPQWMVKSESDLLQTTCEHPCLLLMVSLLENLKSISEIYSVINALVDKVTYPCAITCIAQGVIFNLFALSPLAIKEVIVRVLLERLIVHRPHPWGLMVTLIKLVRDPRFNFWELSFIHSDPDIEQVFEAISKSCLGNNQ